MMRPHLTSSLLLQLIYEVIGGTMVGQEVKLSLTPHSSFPFSVSSADSLHVSLVDASFHLPMLVTLSRHPSIDSITRYTRGSVHTVMLGSCIAMGFLSWLSDPNNFQQ